MYEGNGKWKVKRSKVRSLWVKGTMMDHPDSLLVQRNPQITTSGISSCPDLQLWVSPRKTELIGWSFYSHWTLSSTSFCPPCPYFPTTYSPPAPDKNKPVHRLSFKRCQNSWSSLVCTVFFVFFVFLKRCNFKPDFRFMAFLVQYPNIGTLSECCSWWGNGEGRAIALLYLQIQLFTDFKSQLKKKKKKEKKKKQSRLPVMVL